MPKPAFVNAVPLGRSSLLTSSSVCRRARSSPTQQRSARRSITVARVRRGFKPDPEVPPTLYDAEPIKDIDFNDFDFSKLRGKVVLVVNVASTDTHTEASYKSFTDLLERYQDEGLEIVAFPSNWYGQNEQADNAGVKEFVHKTYTDRITLMTKTDLDWNPVFALGRRFFPGDVIWNFHGKFLFGKKGLPVARFDLLTPHDYLDSQIRQYLYSPAEDHEVPLPDNTPDIGDEDLVAYQDKPQVEPEPEEEEVEVDTDGDLDFEDSEGNQAESERESGNENEN